MVRAGGMRVILVVATWLPACGGGGHGAASDGGEGDDAVDAATPSALDGSSPLDSAEGEAGDPTGVTERTALYDDRRIVDIRLTFTDAEWAGLLYFHAHPPMNRAMKEYFHCAVEIDGATFADAACRPKGNPEYWLDDKKPQLAVKFDHWVDKQRFRGVKDLNLEANAYHRAPVRDRVGMWLMRAAGLKAPRVNHARVYRNGEYLGLYMNIEEIDKEFIAESFGAPVGTIFPLGDDPKSGPPPGNPNTAVYDLVKAEPAGGDHGAFYAKLGQLADVHEMLLQAAAENLLPTGDNWSNGSDNFYYYAPPSGLMVVLPWDLDTILDEYSPTDADLYAFWGVPELDLHPNKLLQLVLMKPDWRAEYEANLVRLRDGPYAQIPAVVAQVCEQILADFIKDPNRPGTPDQMQADCKDMQARVVARTAYVKSVLKR